MSQCNIKHLDSFSQFWLFGISYSFLVALACVPTYDIHVTITYMLPCLKCFYRNSVPFSTTTILNILAVVLQNALTYIFSKISTELSVYKHATRRYRQMTLVKFFLKKA